jgi:hypothetical protein
MAATHVELVSARTALDCAECGQEALRDVVLVNEYGLVLLRGQTCTACGGGRHRPDNLVPAPRRAGVDS